MQTFQENSPVPEPIDILNQCFLCRSKNTTLYKDARGFSVCKGCKDKGMLIEKKKMNKSQKRQFKKMKLEMSQMTNIPHVTLDANGKVVQ